MRYIIGYIIILIFIRYPNYVMKVVLPSCVKLLSYMGYPIQENDGQRSLINYFACLITNISVNEDIRFQLFFEKEPKEIQTVFKETIDDILDNNYELKTQLELTKGIIKKLNKAIKVENESEFSNIQGFKPHFTFGSIEKMKKETKYVVSYIKIIQEIVERSKIAKQTLLNIPNLVNACCTEQLEKSTTFYNYFNEYNEFNQAQSRLKGILKDEGYIDENLHPNKKEVQMIDIFNKYKVKHNQFVPIVKKDVKEITRDIKQQLDTFIKDNSPLYDDDVLLQHMIKHFEDKDWWIDTFYPSLSEEFNQLVNILHKLSDGTNKETLEYIKNTLINLANIEDVSIVRQVAYTFISSKMRQILGKIVNKQKLTEDMMKDEAIKSNPLFMIIASVSANKNYDAVLVQYKQLLVMMKHFESTYFTTIDNDIILQNVFLLAYLIVTFLKTLLFMTLSIHTKMQMFYQVSMTSLTIDATTRDKENLKLSCDIVNYLLHALSTQLKNTIADPSELKLSYEKLRELRKEEEISKYKVDDEERELQIQLKKMGHANWVNILDVSEDYEMSEEQKIALNPTVKVYDEYDMEQADIFHGYKEDGEISEPDEDFISYEAYDD